MLPPPRRIAAAALGTVLLGTPHDRSFHSTVKSSGNGIQRELGEACKVPPMHVAEDDSDA